MSRVNTTPDDVIDSIVLRLREQLGLSEFNCYDVLDPGYVDLPSGGGWFVTVAPGEGDFDQGLQVGGGENEVSEALAVVVTFYVQIQLDQTNMSREVLRGHGRSLYKIKRQILKAMCGVDLQNAAEDTFLRQLIPVRSASRPAYDITQQLAYMSLTFVAEFDWDLTD